MKILYTCFNGKTNSSKILLDNIITKEDKLYLKNSFKTSVEELINKIKDNKYDLIISFGQAPLSKNTIKIETRANNISSINTTYDFTKLNKLLEKNNFHTIISNNAGKYLCNNIYYHGLKYIKENNLKSKMIFIHIPKIKNIDNIKEISSIFNKV